MTLANLVATQRDVDDLCAGCRSRGTSRCNECDHSLRERFEAKRDG